MAIEWRQSEAKRNTVTMKSRYVSDERQGKSTRKKIIRTQFYYIINCTLFGIFDNYARELPNARRKNRTEAWHENKSSSMFLAAWDASHFSASHRCRWIVLYLCFDRAFVSSSFEEENSKYTNRYPHYIFTFPPFLFLSCQVLLFRNKLFARFKTM